MTPTSTAPSLFLPELDCLLFSNNPRRARYESTIILMADNKFEEVFEDGPPKEARTVHRMRANSTIMQINKILGD